VIFSDLQHRHAVRAFALLALLCLAAPGFAQQNSATAPKLPGKVEIVQKLDAQLPLGDSFRDESGKVVKLGDYFTSGRPVVLNFMYYRCPMLCSMVLEGTTSALTELKLDVGKDFDVITVSIDPRDMPEAAAEKKEKYVKRYGRSSAYAGWHFLTGTEGSIKRLTNTVGFMYAYDPQNDQFAHGAALMVITPSGRVSKYFYGFEYKPRDLRLGLVEASAGKIGTTTDQLLLLCYHYDPATGKYSKTAMNIVRAGGVVTMFSLAGFIFTMVRAERRASSNPLTENDKK
jgi:protein SCO1/2